MTHICGQEILTAEGNEVGYKTVEHYISVEAFLDKLRDRIYQAAWDAKIDLSNVKVVAFADDVEGYQFEVITKDDKNESI